MQTIHGVADVLTAGCSQLLCQLLVASTLILIVVWSGTQCLRRQAASLHHWLWLLAMLGLVSLPLVSYCVPHIATATYVDTLETLGETQFAPWSDEREVMPVRTVDRISERGPQHSQTRVAAPQVVHSAESSEHLEGKDVSAGSSPLRVSEMTNGSSWQLAKGTLVVIWLAGVLVLLVRLAASCIRFRRLRARAIPVDDPRALAAVRRLSQQLSLPRNVALVTTPATVVPMQGGLLNPVIFVPTESCDWNADRWDAVLAHELAHVSRCDVLSQFVSQLARAVCWPNPLVWIAASKMYQAQEMACDDAALRNGAASSTYAEQLVQLAVETTRPVLSLHFAGSTRSGMTKRVESIVDKDKSRNKVGGRTRVCFAVAGMIVVIASSVVSPARARTPIQRDPATDKEAAADESAGADAPFDATAADAILFLHKDGNAKVTVGEAVSEIKAIDLSRRLGELLGGKQHLVIQMEDWTDFEERSFGNLYGFGVRKVTLDIDYEGQEGQRTFELQPPRPRDQLLHGTPAERAAAFDQIEEMFNSGRTRSAISELVGAKSAKIDVERFLPYIRRSLQNAVDPMEISQAMIALGRLGGRRARHSIGAGPSGPRESERAVQSRTGIGGS